MDNTVSNENLPVKTGFEKIIEIKNLIRFSVYLVLFLVGLGLGIVIGSGQETLKAKQGVNNQDLTLNPVYSGVTFQGMLKSRNADTVVLEKDAVELVLNLEANVSVFDLKSATVPTQNKEGVTANKKLEDIPLGTNLTGSAVIKKNEKTGKTDLFVSTFIIM